MFAERIKQNAKELGFDLVGIAPAAPPPEAAFYRQWLSKGFAGEMAYMARNVEKRQDCRLLFPPARSVIVCGMSYHSGASSPGELTPRPPSQEWVFDTMMSPKATDSPPGRGGGGKTFEDAETPEPTPTPSKEGSSSTGRIASYARGDDYHLLLKKRLFSLLDMIRQESEAPIEAKVCVDTVPILERLYGYYAGLGWIGKHGGLINQRYGSWFFLGEILLDLDLDYDSPQADRCGECRRCLDACPSGALVAPRILDARRCLSYLTIEYRGVIPEEFRALLGNNVFGCDRCQSVCPWNQKATEGHTQAFLPREGLTAPTLAWLATLNQEAFSRIFRNSPVKRSKLQGLLRNTAIAIGNSDDPALLPLLKRLHEQGDEFLQPHILWAIRRLEKTPHHGHPVGNTIDYGEQSCFHST